MTLTNDFHTFRDHPRRHSPAAPAAPRRQGENPELLVYYFPQWHADETNARLWGDGWTEWDVLRKGVARFPHHDQPKRPLWGETDESDPAVASRSVAAALDAGITGFLVDWYWFDNAPFLNGFLDRGLLAADRLDEFRFALMWANHDWTDLFPAAHPNPARLLPAPNGRYHARNAMLHVMEQYLKNPSYYRVDGAAYFSVYDVVSFVEGLGGERETAEFLSWFRDEARARGCGELHLNAIVTPQVPSPEVTLLDLGFDSATHYTWWHQSPNGFDTFPTTAYDRAFSFARQAWAQGHELPIPYYPNVTMGWDPTPRTVGWDMRSEVGYPFTSVLVDNTPENLRLALVAALTDAARSGSGIVTLNAWNEWTEGSYLEPDAVNGFGYLDAVRAARAEVAESLRERSRQ